MSSAAGLSDGTPKERVDIDILGPFPITNHGNRCVLVAMGYSTQWPEAFAVPDQSTSSTARVLADEVFSHFGALEELQSDQGCNFEVEVFATVCLCTPRATTL